MTRPNADVSAVQRSQEFYRLKEEIDSQGAIYELNESAKAIYIGPDSDVGEVQVIYYNPDEPTSLETATVSVNGPLVGRVDSLPSSSVSSTGQPARILVSPLDVVKPDYDPGSVFTGGKTASRLVNLPTLIDLMIALKPLPSIPEVRADRTIRLPRVPFVVGDDFPAEENGSTAIIVPSYGRRMITEPGLLQYSTTDPLGPIRGVNLWAALVSLTPGSDNPAPRWISGEGQGASSIFIPAYTPPGTAASRTVVIRASDASRAGVTMDLTGTTTGYYFESDAPPPQQFLGQFLGGPRGMADLLVLNIEQNQQVAPPDNGLGYIDLFIKVADRET